jgi:hypothetical protein
MKFACLLWVGFMLLTETMPAVPFDAAPFAMQLTDGDGIYWEDPREIHKVVVHFASTPAPLDHLRLQYWGSRWPEQHLPKDRQPGGADVGWMELGNWFNGDWRDADAEMGIEANTAIFTFRPINAVEFPKVKDYAADFRYTLKLRVKADAALPRIERIEAFTGSQWKQSAVRLEWEKPPATVPTFEPFNARITSTKQPNSHSLDLNLGVVANADPNTFDRSLMTVRCGKSVFTFAVDDLDTGALFLPDFGIAVLRADDARDFAAVASAQHSSAGKTLYDRVAKMSEQTWPAAWAGLPRKKSDIYFPIGLDGGRQRFRLDPDGSIFFRIKDQYFHALPGKDTPRLDLEPSPVAFHFNFPSRPVFRTIQEGSLPICQTEWETNGLHISQTVFMTCLEGTHPGASTPAPDTFTVLMVRLVLSNATGLAQSPIIPIRVSVGERPASLRLDENGLIWNGKNLRGQIKSELKAASNGDTLSISSELVSGESKAVLLKIPFLALTEDSERRALSELDFEQERESVAAFWRRRLDQSARLITPEPMLNEFYRAHAGHLLINCELEPNSTRRFARVGSFHYGAYGNESCMMVVDLDRRGYHREAQECLDAWLHYQSTVGLPGDFASKEGILYGAGGYEDGGYNQHHGWILWCLVEHYRFTHEDAWLRGASPGIVAAADWIIRESARTADRNSLERGLLPAGRLEDIGDWWTWLSTSCYSWRGLDSAAFALEQLHSPEASRIRKAADAFHDHLVNNFLRASERCPVVRLRDGTAVPQIPSYVERRGRSFGWICQTLEGALHMLITKAIDPRSRQAEWILKDYEDNLYLSNQYGYTVSDFEKYWFGRGGMSMQACLLFDVEPYLYRDDIKHALRALFNAESVSYFPDLRMNTEHAAPDFDGWRGDHYKSSDEANVAGWLRQLFLREEGDTLLVGQAVPREWLEPGKQCGIERAATYFGPASVLYKAENGQIHVSLKSPQRNPPGRVRLRFRTTNEQPLRSVIVNNKAWKQFAGDWVDLPGDIGDSEISAKY